MKIRIRRNTIRNLIICIPLLVFMWVLYAFNTYNGDYHIYESFFYLGLNSTFEIGFKYLIVILNYLGVTSYEGFLICVSIFVLGMVAIVVIKNTNSPFVAFLLFFFYPFFLVSELVRYSIVFSIMIFAILVLMKGKKFSIPLYLFLVLLATSIHTSAILFVFLILYKVPISKKTKVKFVLCVSVLIALLSYTNVFYYAAMNLGLSSKLTFWFENHASLGMIVPIFLQLYSMYVFAKSYTYSKKAGIITKINGDVLCELNIIMMFLLPLYFFTSIFTRIFWPVLFINCIYITDVSYFQRTRRGSLACSSLGIMNLIQFVLWSAVFIFPRKDVWLVHFTNNSIL